MVKRKGVFCGMLLSTTLVMTGSAFASEVNTPNPDFNQIGNELVSSGYQQTISQNGDVLIGNPGDCLASYSNSTGNWIDHSLNIIGEVYNPLLNH